MRCEEINDNFLLQFPGYIFFKLLKIIIMNMENKIFSAIDTILWIDWDPIGVNDLQICRDEYRSYVPAIYRLKLAGGDQETIASKLFEISQKEMEITLTLELCRKVAKKILRYNCIIM